MPFTLQDLLIGVVMPALIGGFVNLIAIQWARSRVGRAFISAVGVSIGLGVAYVTLELGPLLPKIDRDWLPYTAFFGCIGTLVPMVGRTGRIAKLIVTAIAAFVVGWFLVPTWGTLNPPRWVHLVIWTSYVVALAELLSFIACKTTAAEVDDDLLKTASIRRDLGYWTPILFATSMVIALLAAGPFLALSGSLRFAQTAAAGMAAMLGATLAMVCRQHPPRMLGISLVYAFFMSGLMLTAKVNSFSSIPTVAYVLLPLTPLGFLLVAAGRSPVQPSITIRRVVLSTLLAATICGIATGLALAAEFGSEAAY